MLNLRDYENCNLIKVICVDGRSYCGFVLDCDEADEEEGWEETITIESRNGEIRMFSASEIEAIEELDKK